MFTDEATITVQGGNGGRGCVSFRREKYEPHGGPNGGDGGRGGDVVIVADENTDTLSDYASRKNFSAKNGEHGRGQNMAGRDGQDLELRVPPGTLITQRDEVDPIVIADLKNSGDRIVVGRGGRGGYGNAHFTTSTRQTPDFAELGEPGEKHTLTLDLKLVADVGIIGCPSVGKSTLISVISRARPKIAAYPFTTLVPNLGVAMVDDRSFVVCDVPGLIEGASEGKGLGEKFLRHIERCGVLLHLLDLSRALQEGNVIDIEMLIKDYKIIRNELAAYSPTLAEKRELVILNKIDLVPDQIEDIVSDIKKRGIPIAATISSATTEGTSELLIQLLPIVLEEREKRAQEAIAEETRDKIPVLRPGQRELRMGAYRIEDREDAIIVHGQRIEQFTQMTDFQSEGGKARFIDVIERIGLLKALRRARAEKPRPIEIGGVRVEEYL